jgi:hypothetical protein
VTADDRPAPPSTALPPTAVPGARPCRSNVAGNHEYEPDRDYDPAIEGRVCGQPLSAWCHDGSLWGAE